VTKTIRTLSQSIRSYLKKNVPFVQLQNEVYKRDIKSKITYRNALKSLLQLAHLRYLDLRIKPRVDDRIIGDAEIIFKSDENLLLTSEGESKLMPWNVHDSCGLFVVERVRSIFQARPFDTSERTLYSRQALADTIREARRNSEIAGRRGVKYHPSTVV
jgi:hypothetical protein